MSNTIPISDARANLPELVNKAHERGDRFIITVNGRSKAVLLSQEELESIEETAEILAIPGARESIKEGMSQADKGLGIPLEDLE